MKSVIAATRDLPHVQLIIMTLDRVLASSPSTQEEAAERAASVRKLSELLTRAGIDAESLIRYGMPHRAAFVVYLAMITSGSPSPLLDVRRWRSLLRVQATGPDEDHEEQVRRAPREGVDHVPALLNRWVENARLSDILSLTPPTDEEWARTSLETSPSADVTEPYLWLWQRNAVNDLDRWLTTSLHREYQWQNRHEVGLFSEAALASDGPAAHLLNAAIAQRAVDPETKPNDDGMFWALQDAAVRYLQQDKYAEAVTLFEFHRQRFPEDARALNNLGFCTMPINPSRALHWLQKAVHFGYVEIAINVYNQCCCLERLNRAGEALDKAEAYWQRQRVPSVDAGFLWVPDAGGWTLEGDRHPEEELAALAIRVSESLGLDERARRWRERLELLRLSEEIEK